jgi:hypothetical protein
VILSLASWHSKPSIVNFGIQNAVHKNVRDWSQCQDDRQLEDASSFPVPIPRFFIQACRREAALLAGLQHPNPTPVVFSAIQPTAALRWLSTQDVWIAYCETGKQS